MRATGMPKRIVAITALQAEARSGNEQTAAEIALGRPWSLTTSSVMIPNVPSAPMNSRVMS